VIDGRYQGVMAVSGVSGSISVFVIGGIAPARIDAWMSDLSDYQSCHVMLSIHTCVMTVGSIRWREINGE